MKALHIDRFSEWKQAKLKEIERPTIVEDEVLIKVHASSVNDFDIAMMIGKPYVLRLPGLGKPKFNVSGCDVAGVVESIGPKVSNVKVGERVLVDLSNQKWGGYAEYAVSKASEVSKLNEGMSFCEAAALPQAGVLALQALKEVEPLNVGDSLLINGAGGGAGHIIIKLAKKKGLHVTVVDSKEKSSFLHQAGADETIDYTELTYQKSGKKYDRIIDLKASGRPPCYFLSLNRGGKFSMVGGTSSSIIGMMTVGKFLSMFSSKSMGILAHKPSKKDVDTLLEYCEKDWIQPIIDSTFPLSEWQEAFERYESFNMKGKVIIEIGGC